MSDPTLTARHQKTAAITLIGAFCNLFLALVKCAAGWFGQSQALFADGIHSFSDLFTDLVVYVASKFGNVQADLDHPYGHQRIETVGTIVVAAFLLAAAVTIIVSGIKQIVAHTHHAAISPYVLWIALLSLIINESIYHITLHIAKEIHSDILRAHAWHRRSDAATALIVLIGVVGSMLGFHLLDGISAIIIGCFILRMAWKMGRNSFDELIDRGLNQAELAEISATIQQVPGVQALHQLRTRLMGGQICADVHIIVERYISVSEGHYIGDQVLEQLKKKFPQIHDIIIHVDSENDELQHDAGQLPARRKIIARLFAAAQTLPEYQHMQLKAIHYFNKNLLLELVFPADCLTRTTKQQLHTDYQQALDPLWQDLQINIFFF